MIVEMNQTTTPTKGLDPSPFRSAAKAIKRRAAGETLASIAKSYAVDTR
jgi:hypothetical protein